jgi:hypothetical protein
LYTKLVEAYEGGMPATLRQDKIEEEILKLRLTSTWTRSLEAFLTGFEHKLLDLESVTQIPIPDKNKRKGLISAIRTHEELYHAVYTTLIVEKKEKHDMSYDDFYAMVLDHAMVLDQNNKDKTGSKQQRKANKTEQKKHSPNKDSKGQKGNKDKDTAWVDPEKWKKMTKEQKQQHLEKWRKIKSDCKAQTAQTETNTNPPPPSPHTHFQTHETNTTTSNTGPPSNHPGTNLRSMLSANQAQQHSPDIITVDGRTYRACMSKITYHISQHSQVRSHSGSLVDGGCNGGLAGDDVIVLDTTYNTADITGIGGAKLENIPIGTVAGLINTTQGPAIAIFHQYAIYGKGKTIYSVNQCRSFGLDVNDTPKVLPHGRQSIETPDGYVIPLSVRDGLPHMDMRCPTDDEMAKLPRDYD